MVRMVVLPPEWGDATNEVYSNMRPGTAGNWQRVQQAGRMLVRGLNAGTEGTGRHKGTGVLGHGRPPEFIAL